MKKKISNLNPDKTARTARIFFIVFPFTRVARAHPNWAPITVPIVMGIARAYTLFVVQLNLLKDSEARIIIFQNQLLC